MSFELAEQVAFIAFSSHPRNTGTIALAPRTTYFGKVCITSLALKVIFLLSSRAGTRSHAIKNGSVSSQAH
jgi:hypothetical protein